MNRERLKSLASFEKILSYSFRNKKLLDTALTHRSFINENPAVSVCDNERLEFLGDAVLELCVSHFLMDVYTDYREGPLSRMRASIVNEHSLAALSKRFMVGDFLLLGKGEDASGGRTKASILSNTFEAIIAAIYLDSGFYETYAFLKKLFTPMVEASGKGLPFRDYKTSLQEACQIKYKAVPKYSLIHEYGPDHDKIFQVKLAVADIITTTGVGKCKKDAEQEAAMKALEAIEAGEKS